MLELQRLTRWYGDLVVLDDLSFTVADGQTFGFTGPNGAGTTTAMGITLDVLAPDVRKVHWRGQRRNDELRHHVGHIREERGLYPRMRVRDQLRYLGQLCGRTSQDVNRTVDTWLERLGLTDRISDRLDALSHGNQQRVQLIAALVNEPDLLVLDEPFSGLDPIAMGNMSELLGEVAAAGATVLFSSHQLDLVEDLCEDVVIIDHGRIVLAGELEELRAAVPQRFVDIRYRGAPPDWSALPSVELVGSKDGQARLRVDDGGDLAAVVAIARSTPEIVSFAYQPPTLSELFRRAVAA